MITQSITVQMENGLTSHSASAFIQKANQFPCQLHMEYETHRVNAKSLLGVLSLDIKAGAEVTLTADGPEEADAAAALTAYLRGE